MAVHLFGIRHHGPGCARSLALALRELQPDCILIEGPPEADDLLALARCEGMQPPVALLVYAPFMPQHAVYYPFAEFSPEWQAIIYGQQQGVPTRFFDLPQAHGMAQQMMVEEKSETSATVPGSEADLPDTDLPDTDLPDADLPHHGDALGWLAHAAGFSDSETWWDHLVEQRQDSLDLFAAIEEMMTVAREELGPGFDGQGGGHQSQSAAQREAQREAYMRQMIRHAIKQGHEKIAVVCGAWHVPALRTLPSAKADAEILKNLPKAKVAATWTPWTYARLASNSGYGAGIAAPGWYHHCWHTPHKAALYWLTDAARLLRENDLDASSAHIIEVLRLADTLASMRERSRAGLDELLPALQSVLFGNSDAPMRLIESKLLINDQLGQIPPETPMLPLPGDVKTLQKRLRLAVSTDHSDLNLDLRQELHLEKSIFLHRLGVLGVAWGQTQRVSGKSGSFHELWRLAWKPEFELALIEANVWGQTVESAVNARLCHQAQQITQLPLLTELVEKMLLADAKPAVPVIMAAMQALAAHTHDVGVLLAALAPLANVLRYGNTRSTDIASVAQVFAGLLQRACIALPLAAHGINSEAAQVLMKQIIQADQALKLLQDEAYTALWLGALAQSCGSHAHALVAGRAVRLLIEHAAWSVEQTADALSLACSNPINPLASAEWLEGFLQGSGLLLVMNDSLWQILHDWVAGLPEAAFTELLPLLRRTFATFEAAERRQLGQRVGTGALTLPRAGTGAHAHTQETDPARAALVLPILRQIFCAAVNTSPESTPRPTAKLESTHQPGETS